MCLRFPPFDSGWLLFGNSFIFSTLSCEFTPTGEFVLRQLLNRGGMNKFSQLTVSTSFTLRVTCLDLFLYMLPNVSIQSIEYPSHVLRLV
jgi:hypothetical protein